MNELSELAIEKPLARMIAEELILDFGTDVPLPTVQGRSNMYGVDWRLVKEAFETATVTVSWDD